MTPKQQEALDLFRKLGSKSAVAKHLGEERRIVSRRIARALEIEAAEAALPDEDVAPAIGTDERRMHVRAYNYWCSLLDGRDFPSIQDLEPATLDDFGPHAVLLDFTQDRDNPGTPYIGDAIREECGLDEAIQTPIDLSRPQLLERLELALAL